MVQSVQHSMISGVKSQMTDESKELDSVASIGERDPNRTGNLPEIHSPTQRNINLNGSPMNVRGSGMKDKRMMSFKRMSTKSEEVLAKNNFQ